MNDELDDLKEQTRGSDRISASTGEESEDVGKKGDTEAEQKAGDTETAFDDTPTSEKDTVEDSKEGESEKGEERQLEVELEVEVKPELQKEVEVEVEAETEEGAESEDEVEVEVEVEPEEGVRTEVQKEVEVGEELEVEVELEVGTESEDYGLPEPSSEFRDTYETNARRARRGVNPRSFSADDPGLSALLLSLQQTGELEEVGGAIREELNAPEPPEYDQDAVVRLALTYAVNETAPGYFEVLANGS